MLFAPGHQRGGPDSTRFPTEEGDMPRELIEAITGMREADALRVTEELLAKGTDSFAVLHACREAMEIIGRRFEAGDCFLPELTLAGVMVRQISEMVKPRLQQQSDTNHELGKVLIGTVAGDIHDIGKDLVVFMLEVNGFEVMDLGVDVPATRFVAAAREFRPDVVALSGFLTLVYDAMKATIDALKEAGLRDDLRIMIGGGQVDDQVCRYAGADAYGRDAVSAVSLAKNWTGGE
jgi:5-methyltetrahydrofolate--homocysteine methyltransferase